MPPLATPILDIHVHVAGNQTARTGCVIHPRRLASLPFRLIRRSLRVSREEFEDIDATMVARLHSYLTEAPHLRIVILGLDWARDESGEPLPDITDLYIPNEYPERLAREHPQILAGASVHPLRKDALEELNRAVAAGAVLVKWLPISQNFSPADERCQPFLQEMARLGIPLLCHTGSEGATRNLNKDWNDPRLLEPALDAGVTVIAAHAGTRSLPHDHDYFETWAAMIKDYPHFYGDTASVFGLRARRFAKEIGRELVVDRLVHGSDWPIPNNPWWFVGTLAIHHIRELARIRNPLLRDVETKRIMGLPDAVFSRGLDLLPASARRA